MRKRWIGFLALALLICLIPVCASAYEAIQITSVQTHTDGTVSISWDNPNGGPVTVGIWALPQEDTGTKIQIERNVSGQSFTFATLAPGVEYALLVFPDLDLSCAGFDFVTLPEPGDFDDFRLSVTDTNLTYFVQKGNDYSYNYAHSLSNRKIYEMLDEKQFWVRMNFRLNARSHSVTYPALTVVTAPNGYVTTQLIDMEIKKNWQSYWYTMLYMNDAFEELYEKCGEIPTGEYHVKLYLDGKFLSESSFTIDR